MKRVSGDEWVAGNLSYHLKDRPVWQGAYQGKALSTGKKIFEAEVVILNKTGIISIVVPRNLLNKK